MKKNILKSYFLNKKSKISEAISILQKNIIKLVIIVEKEKLIGIITDGDIRRGLLSKESPENSVINIMNKTPVTVSIDTPRHIVDKQMKLYGIEVIIITDNDSVIGLFTAKDASSISLHDNPILIMAGGFGTRLKPLTDNCPKPMLHVGNKPILEWQIDMFSDQGFNNFFRGCKRNPLLQNKRYSLILWVFERRFYYFILKTYLKKIMVKWQIKKLIWKFVYPC